MFFSRIKSSKKFSLIFVSVLFSIVCLLLTGVSANADPLGSGSCALSNATTINYNANILSIPATDDAQMYLYELEPFEYSVSSSSKLIGTFPLSNKLSYAFPLTDETGVSRICKKYAVAVKINGAMAIIVNPQYIINPEKAATHTRGNQAVGFVEPTSKMVLYRIGETDLAAVARDMYSTAVIVNRKDSTLINPCAKGGDSHSVSPKMYYMFNAATKDGVAKLQSTMTYFAANTYVDEFIIGNEVNTRIWNYAKSMSWEQNVREYAQAFRVCYNSIKSTNANAKVFISLDQMWNMDNPAGTSAYYSYMDGLDYILTFNSIICSEGNIDWGLAFHPYLYPMTYTKFWDPSGLNNAAKYTTPVAEGRVITFQNLPVMTSTMNDPTLKNPQGKVRDIILPEIGVTQYQGVEAQTAAMMACYQASRNNPNIKRIYFHRMNEGGKTNFSTTGASEELYNALVSGNAATISKYNSWSLGYIGISDWRQIVAY